MSRTADDGLDGGTTQYSGPWTSITALTSDGWGGGYAAGDNGQDIYLTHINANALIDNSFGTAGVAGADAR